MDMEGKNIKTWVQCQTCGKIYQIPCAVSIEKLYVLANCPTCGVTTGLNLGEKKEDLYYFMDINMDSRYY